MMRVVKRGVSRPLSDQLTGWKEIAVHIGRGVRQAQRWEKLGMPVHRVSGLRHTRIARMCRA